MNTTTKPPEVNQEIPTDEPQGVPCGRVGDEVVYKEPWGEIVRRCLHSYYVQGHRGGLRVLGFRDTWAEARKLFYKERRLAERSNDGPRRHVDMFLGKEDV